MGTIAQKLQAVANSKAAIKQALANKGLSPSDVLSTYAGLMGMLQKNLCGTLTFSGTYATSTYYNAAGCRMGCNDNGEVFLIIQGGTSTSYENVVFALTSAPAGIALAQTTTTYTHASNSAGNHFGCVLTGVAKKVNIAVNFNAIDGTYDHVRAALTVTEA